MTTSTTNQEQQLEPKYTWKRVFELVTGDKICFGKNKKVLTITSIKALKTGERIIELTESQSLVTSPSKLVRVTE